MLSFVVGDIFHAECEALVNPVNCVGVMGAGLAKQFKQRLERNYKAYKHICDEGLLIPGGVMKFELSGDDWREANVDDSVKYILNVATKDSYKNNSSYDIVQQCLINTINMCEATDIESVAIPALGCGLDGLKWSAFRNLATDILKPATFMQTLVFCPQDF